MRWAAITGPTKGGLGFFTALELARAGAHVVLAGRTDSKLAEAEQAILDEVVGAQLSRLVVDLSSLDSVRSAAGRFSDAGPLHLLVNNAGIMATPYARTPDGFECVGQERNAKVAVLRRVWDIIPVAGDLPIPWLFHFDFNASDGSVVMSSTKKVGLKDTYFVDLPAQANGWRLDWRVAAAMAVALDALQSR